MRLPMTFTLAFLACLTITGEVRGGMPALYQVSQSPYSTYIAQKVGDILTVDIAESASTQDDGTSTLKKNSTGSLELANLYLPKLYPRDGLPSSSSSSSSSLPGLSYKTNRNFQANEANTSVHRMQTKLQARIIEVIRPGEFVVRGMKEVHINGKQKKIFLSGIVRQRDIDPSNTIDSYKIADARFEIEGEINSKDLKPGIFDRLVGWMF
ncbi:MAG: flgH [Chlamydiales bacterium]|jgi:flagellar L-ring protein precursor FlgH|nr:flgH [Chlamydiales bacterium]